MTFSSERIKQKAVELGFNMVGITRAEPSPTLDAYFAWIDAGMHGSMNYMARPDRQARRRDLNVIVPGARSLLIVGMDYASSLQAQFADELANPARGRIASYAWSVDYHDIMTPRLEALGAWLRDETGIDSAGRAYVDTGAILERSHAQEAGFGFVGKNTMLIHPRRGSYFFLGEIVTDLEFDAYDSAGRDSMCGSCTRCLTACPTDAFPRPYVLDARRCISYLTIENKGSIPREMRPLMGNWVYGCDVCQDVCPWQRFAPNPTEPEFTSADLERAAPLLHDLLNMDDVAFKTTFADSPILRIKRPRMVRNACIASGNSGDTGLIPTLERLLADESPLVRRHAAWAIHRLDAVYAHGLLRQHLATESDAGVHQEITELVGV